MNIFLVDDDEIQLEIVSELLTWTEINIITSSSSDGVVPKIIQSKPSLIILDLYMPNKDGIALCKEIKNTYELKDIPIMFMSGSEDKKDRDECYAIGGIDFLLKPVPHQVLLRCIRKYCNIGDVVNSGNQIIR